KHQPAPAGVLFSRTDGYCFHWSHIPNLAATLKLSKLDSQTELNRTRRIKLRRDYAKRLRIQQIECRIGEHDVIEDIQEIGREQNVDTLCKGCSFAHRHVQIPERQAAKGSAEGAVVLTNIDRTKVADHRHRVGEQVQSRPASC